MNFLNGTRIRKRKKEAENLVTLCQCCFSFLYGGFKMKVTLLYQCRVAEGVGRFCRQSEWQQ